MDGDRGVVQRGVALRALLRQRNLDGAIDLLRRRGRSMAGRMPGLAPRSFGVSFGRPLGEGSGLSLPRPSGLLQLGLQSFHLAAQLINLTGLAPGQIKEFLVSGRLAIHDGGFTRARERNATGQRSKTR